MTLKQSNPDTMLLISQPNDTLNENIEFLYNSENLLKFCYKMILFLALVSGDFCAAPLLSTGMTPNPTWIY